MKQEVVIDKISARASSGFQCGYSFVNGFKIENGKSNRIHIFVSIL